MTDQPPPLKVPGDLITDPTADQILAVPLATNDSGASTIRGYLIALLAAVWDEKEGFSGKRPFGNSSWDFDLFAGLVKAKFIAGELDEDGYFEDCDYDAGDALISMAIKSLVPSETDGDTR